MNYLATINDVTSLADNLRAARQEVGSGPGSGDVFLKVNKSTGAVTFGQENTPLPPDRRFVVALNEIAHGYLVRTAPPNVKVLERHLRPMAEGGERPTPPGGAKAYGKYEDGGAVDVTELVLHSIDEPGFRLTFTSWNISSSNRVGNLLDEAIVHLGSADGKTGFVHPVIAIKSGSYTNNYGVTNHFDYVVVDWLHKDGKTLLSSGTLGRVSSATSDVPERMPYDDEDMTDAEREMLGAS